MNYLSSRQVYAAAKVVGCIGAIPLSILILHIPYTSVLFTVSFTICILRADRSELFSNSFKDTLAGLITGFMLPVCAVLYHLSTSIKDKGELIGVITANIISISFGGVILFIILFILYIIILLFNHFMKGCLDNK